MRLKLLKEDLEYFEKHFPEINYHAFNCVTSGMNAIELESILDKGWNKDSKIQLNFFEALAWLRWDDPCYVTDVKWTRNEYDSEMTYSGVEYQKWVVDEKGNFDILRYASFIYNMPIRVCKDINEFGLSKQEQCIEVKKFIEKFSGFIAEVNP